MLAALAARERGEPVKTFSIGFEEEGFNELDRARLVAERYGTEHHELVVRPDAVELLPRLVEAFDEPFGDSSALPTYLVSELAAGHVKVALSGEGGDELFGGYYTYVADLLAPRVGRLAALRGRWSRRCPAAATRSASTTGRSASRAPRAAAAGAPPRLEGDLLRRGARRAARRTARRGWDPVDLYRARYAETGGAEALARLQDVDLGIYLVDDLLVKTDRLSMAHSLELRVPFLDQRGRRVRLVAAARAEGARPPQEAAAARGGGAAAAGGDRRAAASRASRSRRRLAARRRWSRSPARCSRRSALARQGLLDPDAVTAAARPPRRGAGGPQPPDLGPDGLQPLVRPLRRH